MSADDARARALVALARAKAALATPNLSKANPATTEAELLERLAEWFASPDAIHASALPGALVDGMVGIGIDRTAAVTAGQMVLGRPMSGRTRAGSPEPTEPMSATRRVASGEPQMRAQYVLAAARRLTQARADDRYSDGLSAENRYLDQHIAAGRNRRAAAQALDEVGKDNELLVWRTAGDSRVTPECRALEGRIFTVDNPPAIPGAVHPKCRCYAEPFGPGPLIQWGTLTKATEPDGPAPFVMIIRHAEKPDKEIPRGMRHGGEPDVHSLIPRGWIRAGALAEMFASSPRPGLVRPTAIYAASGEDGAGRRLRQTVRPLAERLGLDVNVEFNKEEAKEAELAAQVAARSGPTLICWHHEAIPALVKEFGPTTPPVPDEWDPDRFDLVWTLTPDGNGGWVFAQVPELLLDGDSDEPIK